MEAYTTPPTGLKKHTIAVYGTLMGSLSNTVTGVIRGQGRLYQIPHGGFPCWVEDVDEEHFDTVVEVGEINDMELQRFDRYESVDSGLFRRIKVQVYLENKMLTDTWVYAWGKCELELEPRESGIRWAKDCQHQEQFIEWQPAEPDVGIMDGFGWCESCGKKIDEDFMESRHNPNERI